MIQANASKLVFLSGLGFAVEIWSGISCSTEKCFLKLPSLNADYSLETILHYLNDHIPYGATVVSWSLSGLLSLFYAHYFPNKNHRFILVASTPKFLAADDWPGLGIVSKSTLEKKFTSYVQYPSRNLAIKRALTKLRRPICSNYLTLLSTLDARAHLKTLTVPLTLILGERDCIVPSIIGNAICTLNPKLKLVSLPNAGHAIPITHKRVIEHEISTT